MKKISVRHDVSIAQTAEQVISLGGIGWEPETRELSYVGAPEGVRSHMRAIVRSDTGDILGAVRDRFTVNPHTTAVLSLDPLIRSGALVPACVNVWGNGRKMAIQFRCPDLDVRIGPRSVVNPLFTLAITHDGKGSDLSFFADFDFWCRNQCGIVARIAGDGVRHMAGVRARYDLLVADRLTTLANGELSSRYDTMRKMAESKECVAGKRLMSYFAEVHEIPTDKLNEQAQKALHGEVLDASGKVLRGLTEAWRADDHGVPGSIWHAYSAVTRYATHEEGRSEASRSERALFGNSERNARAFTLAAKMLTQGAA